MMAKQAKFKVDSWNQLIKKSTRLKTDREQYMIPMGVHGLAKTKVILDADDEIYQDYKYYDENKWSQMGSIMLIGTEY